MSSLRHGQAPPLRCACQPWQTPGARPLCAGGPRVGLLQGSLLRPFPQQLPGPTDAASPRGGRQGPPSSPNQTATGTAPTPFVNVLANTWRPERQAAQPGPPGSAQLSENGSHLPAQPPPLVWPQPPWAPLAASPHCWLARTGASAVGRDCAAPFTRLQAAGSQPGTGLPLGASPWVSCPQPARRPGKHRGSAWGVSYLRAAMGLESTPGWRNLPSTLCVLRWGALCVYPGWRGQT